MGAEGVVLERPFDRRAIAAAMLVAALALAYYVGVQIGFAFTLEPNAVSLLWPPNAIVLSGLLLAPVRTWGWLLAAVLPAHLIAELSAGVSLAMASCWYVSNATEALLGAAVIRSFTNGPPRFDRIRDVSIFLLAGVLLAPVVSSFIDAGFVALVQWRYDGDYWRLWRMRLFSNALAAIILPPLVVIASTAAFRSLRGVTRAQYLEGAALATLLGAVSFVVFHQPHSPGNAAIYVYAPLPLLVWAAVRMGVAGVTLCISALALISITGTLRGLGPFALAESSDAVLSLQIFLIITALSLMLLAAALAELRDARAAALRRKESLDLALSAAHMGTWDWDLEADQMTWRLGTVASASQSRDGASSAELFRIVHPDDRATLTARMASARDQGEVQDLECRFICGEDVRWVLAKGRLLRGAAGEPRRMIGVCIDITQRKQQEMQERLQREQLAHLSRSAMLGELSGAVAHELSQPLAAILMNAQAAQYELQKPAPNLHELAAIIADISADDARAAEVIGRLRALFLRGEVRMERVDVAECIRGVLALEHSDLIARSVMTQLDLSPTVPAVKADRVQLQQVLLNLIVNACEAMDAKPMGERRLRISAHGDQKQSVLIEICDSGSGVEDFDRIFEPFFSTRKQSIGLGLAISRKIIATHGGRLWGANNAGGGATFHVSLPVA